MLRLVPTKTVTAVTAVTADTSVTSVARCPKVLRFQVLKDACNYPLHARPRSNRSGKRAVSKSPDSTALESSLLSLNHPRNGSDPAFETKHAGLPGDRVPLGQSQLLQPHMPLRGNRFSGSGLKPQQRNLNLIAIVLV